MISSDCLDNQYFDYQNRSIILFKTFRLLMIDDYSDGLLVRINIVERTITAYDYKLNLPSSKYIGFPSCIPVNIYLCFFFKKLIFLTPKIFNYLWISPEILLLANVLCHWQQCPGRCLTTTPVQTSSLFGSVSNHRYFHHTDQKSARAPTR